MLMESGGSEVQTDNVSYNGWSINVMEGFSGVEVLLSWDIRAESWKITFEMMKSPDTIFLFFGHAAWYVGS